MQFQTLLLSVWFTIQGYSCTSTPTLTPTTTPYSCRDLPKCPPCQYRCKPIKCKDADCKGPECEWDTIKKCHEQCPPDTREIRFSQNSSMYFDIIVRPNDTNCYIKYKFGNDH